MSQYKQADGYNVALVSLSTITPQPQSHGVQGVQRYHAVSGEVHEQGLFIVLRWNVLSVTQYQTLLTALGLLNALTNQITIYAPNHNFTYQRYNGIVVRPENGTDLRRAGHFLNDIAILVTHLAAL